MKKIKIFPKAKLTGKLQVPGDKSITHRALIISSLAWAKVELHGWLQSLDCIATKNALQALGVKIESRGKILIIDGVGLDGLSASTGVLDLGNSGTGLRLLAGVLAAQNFDSVLTGDESLCKRPMMRIVKPLLAMGANIVAIEGKYAPLKITGLQADKFSLNDDDFPNSEQNNIKLKALNYQLPIASGQVQSALQLAGLYATGEMNLTVPGVCRDHTARMLQFFQPYLVKNMEALNFNEKGYEKNSEKFKQNSKTKPKLKINIPGDFSSAAFFIVAALITQDSDLTVTNVGANPTRTGLLEVLQRMGANITCSEVGSKTGSGTDGGAETLLVEQTIAKNDSNGYSEETSDIRVQSSKLIGIDVPVELVPRMIDEFPIFAVAAACAKGVTRIRGAAELRVKETDRIAAITKGLTALGVKVEVYTDGLDIYGIHDETSKTNNYIAKKLFKGCTLNSYGDHRIAMAFMIAGLVANSPVVVEDTANIETSFPGFVEKLSIFAELKSIE